MALRVTTLVAPGSPSALIRHSLITLRPSRAGGELTVLEIRSEQRPVLHLGAAHGVRAQLGRVTAFFFSCFVPTELVGMTPAA